jgi:hypothetical protein
MDEDLHLRSWARTLLWAAPEELEEVTKETVGIHVLLWRSLFACDIPRR